MDGRDLLRIGSYFRELLPQLHDGLIERPRGPVIFVAPNLVEDAVPREDFAGVAGEELEELYLPRRQRDRLLSTPQLEDLGVERAVAQVDDAFAGRDLRAVSPEQSVYARR